MASGPQRFLGMVSETTLPTSTTLLLFSIPLHQGTTKLSIFIHHVIHIYIYSYLLLAFALVDSPTDRIKELGLFRCKIHPQHMQRILSSAIERQVVKFENVLMHNKLYRITARFIPSHQDKIVRA